MDSDESDSEYDVVMTALINRRRKRITGERPKFFSFDEKDFRDRFRMSKESAWMVLQLIRDKIQHKTKWNNALSPEEMLLLTLRFYATGCMQRTGGDLCGISISTVSRVIGKVSHCIALLRPTFVKFSDRRQLQKNFYAIAKFPRVVAAIGCTHVKIISPGGEHPELYRNRKGFFSFNVQTLCDANLTILDIVARWPGSTHEATILRNSRIFSQFEAGEFENSLVIGDSGYPCNKWIMTPLLRVNTPGERLYNESQIRTRNCVERQYGVWKRRFPILSLGIRVRVEKVEAIIIATAVLHNICCLKNDNEAPDVPQDVQDCIDIVSNVTSYSSNARSASSAVREELINNYFESL